MALMLPLKLTIVAVLTGVLLYYGNLPVPDEFQSSSDRWRMRMIAAGGDILTFLENLGLTRTTSVWENFTISLRGAWGATNVTFADTVFDGVSVRVYQPANLKWRQEMIAGVVFIPGGGWIYGSPDSYHGVTVYLASKLNVMLVSINYRKAYEYPFPAAVDDCTKATVWFLQNAERLKVDPNRIAVVGEGAGGNLAAAVVQRLSFESKYSNLPAVIFQGLFYPWLQAFDFNTSSYQQNGHDPTLIFTKRMSARSWSFYLSGNDDLVEQFVTNNHTSATAKVESIPSKILSYDNIPNKFKVRNFVKSPNDYGNENIYNSIKEILSNPDFSPMLRTELKGLPQTYITIGEFDVVRDESLLYADRLEQAGVQVSRRYYPLGLQDMLPYFMEPMVLTDGKKCMQDFIQYAREHL